MKKQQAVCDVKSVEEAKVKAVRKAMLSEDETYELAETFGVLADATRLKIIYALSREVLCVCEIASILGSSISAVSHQLRVLRNMRLVKFRKESRMVYYSLDDDHVHSLLEQGLKHVREQDGR